MFYEIRMNILESVGALEKEKHRSFLKAASDNGHLRAVAESADEILLVIFGSDKSMAEEFFSDHPYVAVKAATFRVIQLERFFCRSSGQL